MHSPLLSCPRGLTTSEENTLIKHFTNRWDGSFTIIIRKRSISISSSSVSSSSVSSRSSISSSSVSSSSSSTTTSIISRRSRSRIIISSRRRSRIIISSVGSSSSSSRRRSRLSFILSVFSEHTFPLLPLVVGACRRGLSTINSYIRRYRSRNIRTTIINSHTFFKFH